VEYAAHAQRGHQHCRSLGIGSLYAVCVGGVLLSIKGLIFGLELSQSLVKRAAAFRCNRDRLCIADACLQLEVAWAVHGMPRRAKTALHAGAERVCMIC
jgi:hypothetical protein